MNTITHMWKAPAILLSVVMCGCRLVGPPGEIDRSGMVRPAEPVAAVDLYLDEVDRDRRPYDIVARITTQVNARDFPTLAEAEAQAYEQLRFHAARAGALAVIDVEQRVMLDGEVVAVDAYEARPAAEDYIISMRAKAVRFRNR